MSRKLPSFNHDDIDLNLLRSFEAIYRERSITAAALTLRVTQPTVSHALGRLRRFFNDELFVRAGEGMRPTPFASRVAPVLMTALTSVRETLRREGTFEPEVSDRTFVLVMSDIGQICFLPTLYNHIALAAPGITVQIKQLPRSDYAKRMEAGELDFAYGRLPELHAGFYQQTVLRDTYKCLARAAHPLLEGGLGLKEFTAARHVIVEPPGLERDLVETELSKANLSRKVALVVPQFLVLREIVAATDLIAVVPAKLSLDPFSNRLVLHDLPFKLPGLTIRQYWHRQMKDDAGSKWFRTTMKTLFGEDSA